MIEIKVMADFGCYPLWFQNSDQMGDINPHSLPISKNLANELILWAEMYDKTLNQDYPPDSSFNNHEKENNFKNMGQSLVAKLKSELGDDYLITFHM